MTVDQLTAAIGPPAPDRVRVVMKARGVQPPRVHPDYRALLASLPPEPAPPRVSGSSAVLAALSGLLVAVLLVCLACSVVA